MRSYCVTVTRYAKIVLESCRCRRSRVVQDAVELLYILSCVPVLLVSSNLSRHSCSIVRHTNGLLQKLLHSNPLHISNDMSDLFLVNFSISVSLSVFPL